MSMTEQLSTALGINYLGPDLDYEPAELFDNYVPYGGGGKGHKNGHYGCKHSDETKVIMSQKKLGKPTWNKGKTGYLVHTEESKSRMSQKLSGSQNGRSILNEDLVHMIIKEYLSQPDLVGVGEIQKNGVPMSYMWSFCKIKSAEYGTTPATIKRLLQKKSWKNVWSEYEV